MLWMFIVYPRAAAVGLLALFAFAATIFVGSDRPAVAALAAVIVAVVGIALTSRVAAWEARQRGGTGAEGSGPIEPWGPAGPRG